MNSFEKVLVKTCMKKDTFQYHFSNDLAPYIWKRLSLYEAESVSFPPFKLKVIESGRFMFKKLDDENYITVFRINCTMKDIEELETLFADCVNEPSMEIKL